MAEKNIETKMRCDNCGYIEKILWQTVPARRGEKCPKCGAIMINSFDIKVWRFINIIMKVNNILIKAFKILKIKSKKQKIRISTANHEIKIRPKK